MPYVESGPNDYALARYLAESMGLSRIYQRLALGVDLWSME